jgi:hypothetical protein
MVRKTLKNIEKDIMGVININILIGEKIKYHILKLMKVKMISRTSIQSWMINL